MAEIVNLRSARKTRERAAREAEATENRERYGLTKPQKAKAGSERARLLASLDGARLERGPASDISVKDVSAKDMSAEDVLAEDGPKR